MKRITFAVVFNISLAFLFLMSAPRQDFQDEQLQIRLSKDWGFSSGTGKIQGTFTIKASGPDDLARVVFYVDDQVLGEATESPHNLQFNTDGYALGTHTLHATGFTAAGGELTSNAINVEIVTSDEGWKTAMNIMTPLVVIILIAVALAVLVPLIFTRGKKESLPPGAPRNYGYYGGAICPKCSRPFSRHIYGLNLGTHKFDRCPYCGKWSLVRRASKKELEAAETAESEAAQAGTYKPEISEEDELRRGLENSRYED